MTFQELQDEVTTRVIDMPASVVAQVPSLVNKAYRRIQAKHNFHVMKTSTVFTTTAGDTTLGTQPGNFKQFKGRPYRTADLGGTKWMRVSDEAQAVALLGADREGAPRFVIRDTEDLPSGGGNWLVRPIPDGLSDYSDGEYRVTVPYWRYLPKLTVPSATNWITENASFWIIFDATSQAFSSNWDEQRAEHWDQRARNEWHDVILADKYAIFSEMDTLVPHQGADDAMTSN